MSKEFNCKDCAYYGKKWKIIYGYCYVFTKKPDKCWCFATRDEMKKREKAIEEFDYNFGGEKRDGKGSKKL